MKFEQLSEFETSLAERRIFLTGHTGFTGGWLALWLRAIGCNVSGLALAAETQPNLYSSANIADHMNSQIGDIRTFDVVKRAIDEAKPSVIFHLAAQPLVSRGFSQPLETLATNITGTAHVLEAARHASSVKAVICVTTDKVYADREWPWGYREVDQLGGKDPYAASKACAELIATCYRQTLSTRGNDCLIATARGGNIIGGGDWSDDQIVPDFVRAVTSSQPLTLRNPAAVRPWQHVLSLVHGYLVLAAKLLQGRRDFADAWNFGPLHDDAVPVELLVEFLAKIWKRPDIRHTNGRFPETQFLHLDSAKARGVLDWRPPLNLAEAVRLTAEWYRDYYAEPASAAALTMSQIKHYRQKLKNAR